MPNVSIRREYYRMFEWNKGDKKFNLNDETMREGKNGER